MHRTNSSATCYRTLPRRAWPPTCNSRTGTRKALLACASRFVLYVNGFLEDVVRKQRSGIDGRDVGGQ